MNTSPPAHKLPFTVISKILSYLFHPLFVPAYFFFWLTIRFPTKFEGITPFAMSLRKINVLVVTVFFPAFSIWLLSKLKFIQNIYLQSAKDRIVPYILTMFFYWWMWYLSRHFTDQPFVLKGFYLGIFFTTIGGLLTNNFFKVSMHTMAWGGFFTAVLLTCFSYQTLLGIDISMAALLAGLVGTIRLQLNQHEEVEIYAGYFIGCLCQLIAFTVSGSIA